MKGMKRRWRLWLGLMLLLMLGAALLHPAVRWPLIGWLKREAFYDGMPTSYWRSQIKDYCECTSRGSIVFRVPPDTVGNRIREYLGMRPIYLDLPAVMLTPEKAIPVLVDLLNDDEET